jgi:hypothetical protein
MNNKYIFVNNAINDGIVLYLQAKDDPGEEKVKDNTFMVSVISMLILIYGEEVTNTYYTRDNDVFKKLITKYGYSDENYQKFIDVFDRYYSFDLGERTKPIKKKNKFFNPVQKCLIDMLVAKNNKEAVKIETIIDFYESLFTIKNKNFFKKTYTLMTAYNPYEIDEYFKKQGLLINE